MAQAYILSELEEGILTLTINRPDKLNALNREVILGLSSALDEAHQNPEVRAVIITGSGEKAFVAGADISEFATFSKEEGARLAAEGQQLLFDKVAYFSRPVIAAVNGFALGGGLELAMSAHIRLAATHAKMGLPEVSLGVIPGYGGTQRLPQLVGAGRAFEMIFSAKMIDAQQALSYGLVNAVYEGPELLAAAKELARSFLRNSSQAHGAAIEAIQAGLRGENGYAAEIKAFGDCFQSTDFVEGTTAFLSKRKPQFS
jgi:enoyl-CoA hydratase